MISIESLESTTFSGRRFTRKQLEEVRETVARFPSLSRKELARTLCEHLNWNTPNGKPKTESCLTMLEALEARGVVQLPAKRAKAPSQRQTPTFDGPPDPPIAGTLQSLGPIRLVPIGSSGQLRERFKAYLQTFHYLEYRQPVGAHLGYLVHCEARPQALGCLLFSASAAWALAPRDRWIGWDDKQREKFLQLVLCNDRFLIFPWVDVPNLASHVLSLATQQIGDDWVHAYGYRPALIETFVDPTRFSGTCYRAANWQFVGQTQGRGRLAPDHEIHTSKKDIYLYPLQPDCKQSLTGAARSCELRKRFRNDLQASRTPKIDDDFVSLWEQVTDIFQDVAARFDLRWRVRKRTIDSTMLMLLIFRLVGARNKQSYGTTIDDLWDSCALLNLALAQKNSIAPSSFCVARGKLDEAIFQCANTEIIAAYDGDATRYTWLGHRLFAVDGTKMNLPRELRAHGFQTPGENAHYPQGLVSCLYQLKSQLPYDFDLVSHGNERRCALRHLDALQSNDVVVYDRGYFSYEMLHQHWQTGIHAIFRLQESNSTAIKEFLSGLQTDAVVTIYPSTDWRAEIQARNPGIEIVPLKLRLVRYEIGDSTFCLGTTLLDPRYTLAELKNVYHGRWGIEELFKVSKQIFDVEDFHAKTVRGVKQEVFAHFLLITINRLFANRADREINSDQPEPPTSAAEPAPATTDDAAVRKTNFKNCVHVVARGLEELLLLGCQVKRVVQEVFEAIVKQYQRVRPNRSYPRKSMRPVNKWIQSKENRRRANMPATPLPT
jgi:hypothetical protein